MKTIKEYESRLYTKIHNTPDTYQETGQISGSKVAQPALTAILTMLGVDKAFDDYTLAKFIRGHDVEAKFIERVFDKPAEITEGGSWKVGDREFYWQYDIEKGYRGCTCSIDLLEEGEGEYIIHEIKSVSKMKYDRVCGTGFQKNKVEEPMADLSHCLQVSLYALSAPKNPTKVIIHYVNADDYRVTSFEINPEDYKAILDERIDAIYTPFYTKHLPVYEPYEAWQKGKYNSFQELEKLDQSSLEHYIQSAYPDAWSKFQNALVDKDGGIKYEAH